MSKIAVFSDVHGNIEALSAVINDIEKRGIKNIYCLGDLVGYCVFPNEVINLIKDKNIPSVMGNYDQGVGNSGDDCGCAYKTDKSKMQGNMSINWTNKEVTIENKRFLQTLHNKIEYKLGNYKCLLVHGSPRKINEYLFEDRPDKSLERLLNQYDIDVLICGHTHKPYHKKLSNNKHVINDGSCGKSHDGDPRACYTILEYKQNKINVKFIRVQYDNEKMARAIEESEMPDDFAEILRTGNK